MRIKGEDFNLPTDEGHVILHLEGDKVRLTVYREGSTVLSRNQLQGLISMLKNSLGDLIQEVNE